MEIPSHAATSNAIEVFAGDNVALREQLTALHATACNDATISDNQRKAISLALFKLVE